MFLKDAGSDLWQQIKDLPRGVHGHFDVHKMKFEQVRDHLEEKLKLVEDIQNDEDCSSKDDHNTEILDIDPLAFLPNSPQSTLSSSEKASKRRGFP